MLASLVFAAKHAQDAAISLPVKAGRVLSTLVFVPYPFRLLAAFLASRAALSRSKIGLAAAFAWSPILALVQRPPSNSGVSRVAVTTLGDLVRGSWWTPTAAGC